VSKSSLVNLQNDTEFLNYSDVQQTANDVDRVKCLSSPNFINADHRALPILSGKQLRESIHKWLSPPDPSTNHNIACGTHHKTTATWFFEGSIFQEWKLTGSLLWIHGKRLSHPLSNFSASDNISYYSWLRQKHYLVREFLTYFVKITDISCQFYSDSRYRSDVRGRKYVDGLFLF
jgi:hypothetical protein